eukprot:278788-Pelagomonas_calceolata.AAC.2
MGNTAQGRFMPHSPEAHGCIRALHEYGTCKAMHMHGAHSEDSVYQIASKYTATHTPFAAMAPTLDQSVL